MEPKYKTICFIGEGSYGKVEKATTFNNEVVAIKHIKFKEEFQGVPPSALREMSNLKRLDSHPHLVKLLSIDYKVKEKSLKLVFEYYPYNLKQFIKIREGELTEKDIKLMMKQILIGVAFCHEKKIIHRDLKPQNILLDINGNIKIADFGLSRACIFKSTNLTPTIQTLNYKAPQILIKDGNYDSSVDIWTIGCIFTQFFIKKPLFDGSTQIQQIHQIFSILGAPSKEDWPLSQQNPYSSTNFLSNEERSLKSSFPQIPQKVVSLLEKMLQINPRKRMSAIEALEHEYLKDTKTKSTTSTEISQMKGDNIDI